ncbi:MAG: ATP-binding cassette domain-containing protein [Alphaproteobacteria bacterium]
MTNAVLAVTDLVRHYRLPREKLFAPPEQVYALNGVSFEVAAGASLGIVGESGCGKSTLARLVMALDRPTAGRVEVMSEDVNALPTAELRALRRHFQIVFQDPYGSLDPRHKVRDIVAEPLRALADELDRPAQALRVLEAIEAVGLRAADLDKYPHEFSGGQRQRIAIARALATRPALIVADEPVSALDVSVQAQVLNLMRDLQASHGLAYVLISHDLAVVNYVCAEVAVMYLGRIVERAPTEALFERPAHPYTQALLAAVPRVDAGRRRRQALAGGVPSQTARAVGCPFVDRCPIAESRCRDEAPGLREIAPGHVAACHFA